MFDFGLRRSQLGNGVRMLRLEPFSSRSGSLEGLLRGVLHIWVRNKVYHRSTMFFRLCLRLVDAPQCRYSLHSVVENCSMVLTGARGFFLSMQFWAVVFVSSSAVIWIAWCCSFLDRGINAVGRSLLFIQQSLVLNAALC